MNNYYRNPIVFSENELNFQAIEWLEFNEILHNDGSDDDMSIEDFSSIEDKTNEKYIIRIFGINSNGNSICLNVHDFTPFFYIKVPDTWKSQNVKIFLLKLAENLSKTKKKINEIWKTFDYSKNIITNKCVLQAKHDFFGFSNRKLYKFLRLTFNNSAAMKKAISVIKSHNTGHKKLSGFSKLPLYEANVDPIIKFAHIKNLKFSGWIKTSDFTLINSDYSKSTCQIECDTYWNTVEFEENNSNAPILQASYDIETYSIDGKFPLPDVKGNVITQIATSFKFFGANDFYLKHIICLKKCSPLKQIDDIPVFLEYYNTEEEVLLAWNKLIVKMDPDILYQYNGDQFDGNYLYTRSKILDCDDFLYLGKLKNIQSTLNENSFSSSAYGSTSFKRLIIPGRINFDILIYIKREYKENSYKLDYISEKYLGQNKNPMTAQLMFQYFKEGNPDKIREVAEYCLVDTLLPQRLVDKMHILQNQISMSNVTYVPIRFLIERGQQIKVFSQILKETRKQNFLVPTIDNYAKKNDQNKNDDEDDSFTGATVLPPLKGAYYEPITVCDFASLYPSIIRAHNLCFSTIVLDNQFDNIDGIEYKTFEWDDNINDKIIHHKFKYVQNPEGILPKLLSELTIARKNYKKLMATTEDPFLSEVYNKCQIAVKVSMNSIYGFLAAPMLCCKPIAATVTCVGRTMIENTKEYMEKNYKASVAVYGDSVTGDTPLLLRDPITKMVYFKTIEDIGLNWKSYVSFKPTEITNRKNKLQSNTTYQIWTDQGWSTIKRVIKHSTNKTIHRVVSVLGAVDVTEDHSLLDTDYNILKPLQCNESTELLNYYPKVALELIDISQHQAYILGLFDGYSEITSLDIIINSTKQAKKSYFKAFCQNYKNVILHNNGIIGFKIKNKLLASKLYYLLVSLYGNTIGFDIDYKSKQCMFYLLYINKIYNTTFNKITHMYNLDTSYTQFKTVYDLETYTGRFQAGIGQNIIKNTDSVFIKFTTETSEAYKNALELNNLDEIDSLKTKCIQEAIDLGKIAAKNATQDLFKFPINLEYEKVYCPLLLLSKKRYIGILYSNNPQSPDTMDNKGVVLKRRDNFELLKKTYSAVIDILMKSGLRGMQEATEYIQNILYKIINNEFTDLDDFIISKTLKDNYKSTNIPHLVLANKLTDRDNGSAPKSNDRVPYVFTYPDINTEIGQQMMNYINLKRKEEFIQKVSALSKIHITSYDHALQINKTLPKKVLEKKGKLNQYEKVEDPQYLLKHNLPLDAEYYITFMKTPLSEILALFIDNPDKIFDDIIQEYHQSKW